MRAIKDAKPYTGSLELLSGDTRDLYRKTHETIQRVTRDIEDRFDKYGAANHNRHHNTYKCNYWGKSVLHGMAEYDRALR